MDDDRWRHVSELFATALEQDPAERVAFLDTVAGPDLRREVESLLAASEAVGPFDRIAARMDVIRIEALGRSRPSSGPESDGARELSPGLLPGQRLGRHEIRARLGAGGMGEVYRAFDPRLQREVAIKVLGRRVLELPGALQRFEQEARAASALNHPNIVTVHDIGEESSVPYIVMELVDGESLRPMVSEPCPLELLLHVATQIADGIVAAHEREIVHRDLKPENILVNRKRVAKIVDFGLAQFRLDDERSFFDGAAPERGALHGTLGYLSPEVLLGRPADQRSDQFSLGAILYEMAAGTRAFPGRTALEKLARSLRSEPRPLLALRADLPVSFVEAVARCLRKDPNDRFPSTRDLLDELRAARRGPTPLARPGPMRRWAPVPASRTRLIGRQRELDEIERLIVGNEVRLLTLTGAGGTGKTRLALEVAAVLAPHFAGGVIFVPLSSISDAALVAATIAQSMGVVVSAARPALDGLMHDLRGANAPVLLVLDNFEQVIDAAPAVSELLAACPDLTVLVTSREMLRLYGEHSFPVSPLELPDPAHLPRLDKLAECPAVALFVERAQAANAAFRLTAENGAAVAALCAGLDGLPLAMELAAAHTRVLPPAAMLARCEHRLGLLTGGARDLPGRQQTMRRTIDWSHQFLTETEQAVFRRLAVFAGGFTVEAAQAVADPYGNLGLPLEDLVSALVNKSLLQPRDPVEGEPRFFMLETLREYALERLELSGEKEKTYRAHAAYFLVLVEEGAPGLVAPGQPPWLKRFQVEHDNFRVAMDSMTRQGNIEWNLRLATPLLHYWERGEHVAEGRQRFESLLALEGIVRFPALRARALGGAAWLACLQGDFDRGNDLTEQALQLFRALGDRVWTVMTLVALGNQHVVAGKLENARRVIEQSLQSWEELGDRAGFARSLSNLALVARRQGRFEEARALYQKAAAIFEGAGDRQSQTWALNHEGDVARDQGDLDAAEALYADALGRFGSQEDSWGAASTQADLGRIAQQRGDHARAGRCYRESLATFVKLEHPRGIARLLESLACLAAEEDQAGRGLRLAAAAAVLRDRIGVPPTPEVREEVERTLATMRKQLGAAAARSVWDEGAALATEEAIRLALA